MVLILERKDVGEDETVKVLPVLLVIIVFAMVEGPPVVFVPTIEMSPVNFVEVPDPMTLLTPALAPVWKVGADEVPVLVKTVPLAPKGICCIALVEVTPPISISLGTSAVRPVPPWLTLPPPPPPALKLINVACPFTTRPACHWVFVSLLIII